MSAMPGRIKKGEGTLIGNAGEFYVAAELLKRGVIAALAPRNAPAFDMLATKGSKTVRVRVKTKSTEYTDWQWMVQERRRDLPTARPVVRRLHGAGQSDAGDKRPAVLRRTHAAPQRMAHHGLRSLGAQAGKVRPSSRSVEQEEASELSEVPRATSTTPSRLGPDMEVAATPNYRLNPTAGADHLGRSAAPVGARRGLGVRYADHGEEAEVFGSRGLRRLQHRRARAEGLLRMAFMSLTSRA